MIVKPRELPTAILHLQALLRLVNPSHSSVKLMKETYAIENAGYKGEVSINFPLSFCPQHYRIFHDLRLHDGTHIFQNDTVILNANWLLLIEVKNMAGNLAYDHKQLIQDHVKGYDNPISQVKRHRTQFEKWFKLHDLPSIPMYCLVANSHPQCVINSNNTDGDMVIRTYELPEKIKELDNFPHTTSLSNSQIDLLTKKLLSSHRPSSFNYTAHFGIQLNDIRQGVHCPECSYFPMVRKHGTWYCQKCSHSNKQAHIQTLKDYCITFGPEITNKTIRFLLRLDSPATAKRIMRTLHLRKEGKNKGTKYFLSF